MGRAGRAEKVRAPIGGCNIVLGRESCYVLLSSGAGGREGREGREEREEREGREGREERKGCGRLLAGCNIVLLKWGGGREGREEREEREGREERKGCGHLLETVILYY